MAHRPHIPADILARARDLRTAGRSLEAIAEATGLDVKTVSKHCRDVVPAKRKRASPKLVERTKVEIVAPAKSGRDILGGHALPEGHPTTWGALTDDAARWRRPDPWAP